MLLTFNIVCVLREHQSLIDSVSSLMDSVSVSYIEGVFFTLFVGLPIVPRGFLDAAVFSPENAPSHPIPRCSIGFKSEDFAGQGKV